MELDLDTILWVVGAIGSIGVQTWAIIKFLLTRQDKAIASERQERLNMEKQIRDEIADNAKEARVENKAIIDMISTMSASFNSRLDNILLMLANQKESKGNAKR